MTTSASSLNGRHWMLGVFVVGMPLASAAAIAQSAAAPALDEVVVTARKTEERLQDVPLAITAITADQMAERSIRGLGDIAALTPGLNYEDYLGGNGTPVIRGAAQQRIQDLDQNVSSFFDGIYLPRQYVVNLGVVGLDRVEVVKGPQSALYGRNAFMGAINYVTRKPGDRWQGSLEATVGADDRRDVIGDIGGPIIPGKLFFRVGGGYSEYDGDIANGHPNANVRISPGTTGNLGGWENSSLQARIVFRPIESLEFDASVARFSVFAETPAVIRVQRSTGDTNCGATVAGRRTLYCGELPFRFTPLAPNTLAPEAIADPRGYGLDSQSTLLRGRAEWKPRDTLGFVYEYGKLTSEATGGGASDRDPFLGSIDVFNPSAPRGTQFQVSPAGDLNYHSHELRVQYRPSDRLDLLAGVFASQLHDYDFFPFIGALPLLGTAPADPTQPGWFILSRGRTDVDAVAAFGRVDWRLSDAWRLGAEARYSEEDKTLENGPTSFSPAVRGLTDRWYQFTPRFTVDYRLDAEHLLYASAAKGAKSGGFNLSALLPSQFTFAEDENWTYEIGSKNSFLDGRLRLNAALFYVEWSNQQVSCSALGSPLNVTPPAVICNLGGATIKGIELEGAYALTDSLRLNFGLSYNDATYDGGVIDERFRDLRVCDDVACPSSGAIGGNDLARQSKLQGLVGFEFDRPLTQDLGLFATGDVSYKSKQFSETMNLAYLPARTLANLRLGVRGERWEVSAWSKNLLDEEYATAAFAIFTAADSQYVPVRAQGRTFGLTARYSF